MPTLTVYIPHTSGTMLGARYRQPWLADTAAEATGVAWRGQPVFATRAEAFAWLALARTDTFRLLDFAVARVDADISTDPQGVRRVHLDRAALHDPHRQVVRAGPDAPGPNPSVLNALYAGVHEQAAHHWTSPGIGPDPATGLAHTVWRHTYPIAFHDTRQVLAERIGHAARLLHSDPDPRLDLDEHTRAGLAALAVTATDLATHRPLAVPAPAWPVVADAAAVAAEQRRGGWRYAVDRVWAQALVTAAADGLITAATALTNAWHQRVEHQVAATAAGQAVTGWLRRTLADVHQGLLSQWLYAAGRHPDTPPPAVGAARPLRAAISPDPVDETRPSPVRPGRAR